MYSPTHYNHFDSSFPDYHWPGTRSGHGYGFDDWHDWSRRSGWPRPDDFGNRQRRGWGFWNGSGMRGGPESFMHSAAPHSLFDDFSRDFRSGFPSFGPFPPHRHPDGRMPGPRPHPFPLNYMEVDPPLNETFDRLNLDDDDTLANRACTAPEKCECKACTIEKVDGDNNDADDNHPVDVPNPGRGRGRHPRGGRGRGHGGFGGRGMGHFGPRGHPSSHFDEGDGHHNLRGRGGHNHRVSPRMRGGHVPPYPCPPVDASVWQDAHNFEADRSFGTGFPRTGFCPYPGRGFPWGPWAAEWRFARSGDGKYLACPTCGCTRHPHGSENDVIEEEVQGTAEDGADADVEPRGETVAQKSLSKTAEAQKGD